MRLTIASLLLGAFAASTAAAQPADTPPDREGALVAATRAFTLKRSGLQSP